MKAVRRSFLACGRGQGKVPKITVQRFAQKTEVQRFAQKKINSNFPEWSCPHAHGRISLSRNGFVAQKYTKRGVVYHVHKREIHIFSECDSLGRVARKTVVSYKAVLPVCTVLSSSGLVEE